MRLLGKICLSVWTIALLLSSGVLAFQLIGTDWSYQATPMGEDWIICPTGMPAGGADRTEDGAVEWNYAGFTFTFGPDDCLSGGLYPTFNGVNQVDFGGGLGDGVLAQNTRWFFPSTQDTLECDMRFNNAVTWYAGTDTPPAGQYDWWSVAAHEMGHCLGLDHETTGTPRPVMFPSIGAGVVRRTPTADDIAGRNTIYGGPVCGDGVLESPEQCDDGNLLDGDCCSSSCQFEPATTVCRSAAGGCDVAETCTGTSGTCPVDALAPAGTVCGLANGECDVAEACTGTSPTCPLVDVVKPQGTSCTDDGNSCTQDICDGVGKSCTHPSGPPACGNGCVEAGEECDDGNLINGDGCESNCTRTPVLVLTVTKAGTGSGTVTSDLPGINCGTDCTESYRHNTMVTLTATPAVDSRFEGWSGHPDCTDGKVTMTANITCTATFNLRPVGTTCQGKPATIIGTPGNDSLEGTAGDDVIVGLGGNDRIRGKGGNDIICGGAGNDDLDGGDGNDILDGEDGDDKLQGRNGDDILYGGAGNDSLDGADGNDTLYGGAGNDQLQGRNGDDFLDGGTGTDNLDGNAGIDTCLNGERVQRCER